MTNSDTLKMPNQETVDAISEINELKNNSTKKVYSSFSELLEKTNSDINP